MADKNLIDVPATRGVSVADVEQFKMERSAELEFVENLKVLVNGLSKKVSRFNPVYLSMLRFLKRYM